MFFEKNGFWGGSFIGWADPHKRESKISNEKPILLQMNAQTKIPLHMIKAKSLIFQIGILFIYCFSQEASAQRFSGEIDWDRLCPDTVTSLTLAGMSSIPPTIRHFPNLTTLRITKATDTATVVKLPYELSFCKHLDKIIIEGYALEDISMLDSLRELEIDNHRSYAIPKGIFDLKGLINLGISTDTIPPGFSTLHDLQRLSFYGPFESIPDAIYDLKRLRHLFFMGEFKRIPDGIEGLDSLEFLGFDSSELVELSNSIYKIDKLRRLHIMGAKFKQLHTSFGANNQLTYFSVRESSLENFPTGLESLLYLDTLSLRSNNISEIDVQAVPLGLTHLNLAWNQLTSFPEFILQLDSLKALNLYQNNITEVPEGLSSLNNLMTINLDKNEVATLPADFVDLPSNVILAIDPSILSLGSNKNISENRKDIRLVRDSYYRQIFFF